jgi:single-strand DNA-binding protein
MNKVILVGRLTRDPEVKTTQNQVEFCSFTIAVDRNYKDASGERQADFISCVAWRQKAILLGQYFEKGSRIGIIGNLQSRNYDDKDGKKVYVTEALVDEIEFVDSKKDREEQREEPEAQEAVMETGVQQFYPGTDDDTSLPYDL